MNKETAIAAAGAITVTALCISFYGFAIFPVLTGENVAVIAGARAEPHLITGWAWLSVVHACHLSGECVQAWNLVSIAVLAALCAFVGGRLRGPFGALFAAAMIVSSPLILSPLIDPLGGEAVAAMLLFVLLSAEATGAVPLSWPLQALLAGALIMQDPLYFGAAALYGALKLRASVKTSALPLTCVVGAMLIRIALKNPSAAVLAKPVLDAQATPLAVTAIGVALFVIAPAALYAGRRGFFSGAAFRSRQFAGVIGLGILVTLAGVFSASGDSGQYVLAGEAAIIFAALATVPRPATFARPAAAICFAVLILLQCAIAARYRSREFTLVTAQADSLVYAAIERGKPLCIVRPNGEGAAFLAGGSFLTLYGGPQTPLRVADSVSSCLAGSGLQTQLLIAQGGGLQDFGTAGFALSLAASKATAHAAAVTTWPGEISPPTAVGLPGGHGAFTVVLATPLAPAPELIVTAGFSERFRCPAGIARARLSFAAANPNAGGAPVRFTVTEHTPHGTRTLVTRDLPRAGQAATQWRYYSVPVTAEPCTSLTFTAAATTSNGIAAWAAFVAPAVNGAT